jgi:hypothetical protein
MTISWIGWIATAIFVSSYACKDPKALRRIQALAASLWVAYGLMIHATPVVVANLLVAAIAIYSSLTAPAKLAVVQVRSPGTESGA